MGAPDVGQGTGGRDAYARPGWARVMVDARGVVTGWSAAAQQLLGHPADRVLGRPAADLLATAAERAHEPGDAEGAAASGAERGAILARHRDGRLVPLRLAIRAEDPAEAGQWAGAPRWEVMLAPVKRREPEGRYEPGQGREPEGARQSDLDRALLEALFTQSPVGLFVVDPELRLVRYNAAAEGMQGTPASEGIGKRASEVWPDFSAELAERILKQVLETGEPVIGFEKHGRPPGDPGREHVHSVSAFRLEDADGRVLGAADASVDVTERYLAQQRLAVLAEGGARIGSTLDVMRTAQELAEVAVPRLADSIAVEVLEPVLAGEDIAPGPVRPDSVLRRAASRSRRHGVPQGAYAIGEESTFPLVAPSTRVLADLRPRLISPLHADSDWVLHDPVRGRRMLDEKVHSLMFVPLVAQDRALGIATFYRWGDEGPFQQNDLTLAVDLGHHTALCLDNARRYLREHNSLVALQRSLLPAELPQSGGVEVAHEYVHAGTGGGWVDVVPLSGARVALLAGGAPGRGLGSAAAVGRLRAAVHTLSDLDLEPDELLARLDDLVRRLDRDDSRAGAGEPQPEEESGPRPAGDGAGCTLLYLVYDPVTRRCSVAGAGHPGPAVVYPDGTAKILDIPATAPLGLPGPPFAQTEVTLPEGSVLALYTSGLMQAYQGDGEESRLADLLVRSRGSVRDTARVLTEALVPERPTEDAAVLVARTHALGSGRVASWDLPTDPAIVSTARSLVTRQLSSWALEEEAFATELIASELVTNAVRHAKAPIRLRLIRDRVLTCEVSDGSSTAPRLRHARTSDEGGRGLFLVAQCSERWGTRYTQQGKTIWTEQKLA
ncbi:SpoIIE family protein phosphatase [Streptomyces sp. NPDC059909]|uniref:SpoIIE family protein phosphatase n=1 Tax=Streptomyces sp. NPDC059909 TaxID=3346998 RepID=UPI00364956F8